MYFIQSNRTVVKPELASKSTVAKLLCAIVNIIHLDNFIKGGISAYYLFTHELSSLD